MVVFLDLEEEVEPPEHWLLHDTTTLRNLEIGPRLSEVKVEERQNPNKHVPATRALGCYPVVNEIASHIDLNDLDSLSRTCRQVRVNLLQFRQQIITSTLHCENEEVEPDPEHTFRYRARAADWYFDEAGRFDAGHGKVGQCARDLVNSCRRCNRVVCRNCTIKPPAPVLLALRHRRICNACSRAPLHSLIQPHPSTSYDSPPSSIPNPTIEATKRSLCTCPTAVWLCQPCGRSVRNDDMEYENVWKWRTRYLPSLGGLGVGIGEGNRGVPCGRAEECIAAREVEQEIDCDAEDARLLDSEPHTTTASNRSTGLSPPRNGNGHLGPGFLRHEIEGIGGVVKRKLVRMVKVGACVPEWGDEKAAGEFLVREKEGKARGVCGWCYRMVPGANEQ